MNHHPRRSPRHRPIRPDRRPVASRRLSAPAPRAAIQRLARGAPTAEDLRLLQQTLGNRAVGGLLDRAVPAPGRENRPPPLQRQDEMDEEEPMSAVDPPESEAESGGIWGGIKSAWGWFKQNVLGVGGPQGDQRTTPESGSQPVDTPQEGIEDHESGEWTEEIMY